MALANGPVMWELLGSAWITWMFAVFPASCGGITGCDKWWSGVHEGAHLGHSLRSVSRKENAELWAWPMACDL